MLDRKLTDEIADQLTGDILSYDWLLQITREQLVGWTFDERARALVDSLKVLMIELGVSIGPTNLEDGKIHIQNWGDSVDETILRVVEYINEHGEPGTNHEVAFGFWVGLPPSPNTRTKR